MVPLDLRQFGAFEEQRLRAHVAAPILPGHHLPKFSNHGHGIDRTPRVAHATQTLKAEQECGPTLWVETFAEELEKWLGSPKGKAATAYDCEPEGKITP
jgi:hypothetical protein